MRSAGFVASCATAVILASLPHAAFAQAPPAETQAPPAALAPPAATAPAATEALAPAVAPAPPDPSDWKFAGDFRVRFERTSDQQPTSLPLVLDPRQREVVRFRAGAAKNVGKHVSFGVRVRSGSADDPNSTDITVGDFADSLEVSLDRAYLELKEGGFILTGGKFVNPFLSSELVWDGDVHAQGVGASFASQAAHRVKPKLVGLYYVVDEQAAGPDSFMVGGQAQLAIRTSSAWSAVVAGSYYDYTIKSLRGADAGDTRTNRLATGGLAYVSDFDLVNAVVTVDHRGFGKKYPVRLVGDYVKNLGAANKDAGFGFDVFVGRASEKGDLRFRYGYGQAATDAVFAAFSHDNTTLATNYKQHTATVDWQLRKEIQLNATFYLYQKLNASPSDPNPWVGRLRLNALASF